MLKVAKGCGFPPNKMNEWKKELTEFFPEGFKVDELQEGAWERTAVGQKAVNSVLRFANWLVCWGQDTTHNMGERHEMRFPMIYSYGSRGKVLVFGVPIISEESPPPGIFDLEVFVPSCLLRDEYARLGRAWILHGKIDLSLEEAEVARLARMMERSLNIDVGPTPNLHDGLDFPNILHQKTRLFSDVSLMDEKESGWMRMHQMRIYGRD
jgi:hypothetical protein